jgi:hypothetical protein
MPVTFHIHFLYSFEFCLNNVSAEHSVAVQWDSSCRYYCDTYNSHRCTFYYTDLSMDFNKFESGPPPPSTPSPTPSSKCSHHGECPANSSPSDATSLSCIAGKCRGRYWCDDLHANNCNTYNKDECCLSSGMCGPSDQSYAGSTDRFGYEFPTGVCLTNTCYNPYTGEINWPCTEPAVSSSKQKATSTTDSPFTFSQDQLCVNNKAHVTACAALDHMAFDQATSCSECYYKLLYGTCDAAGGVCAYL